MSKEEFVEMLTIMSKQRSKSGYVMAAYESDGVGDDDPKAWASLLCVINGKLYVDDSDEEPLRGGGGSSVHADVRPSRDRGLAGRPLRATLVLHLVDR